MRFLLAFLLSLIFLSSYSNIDSFHTNSMIVITSFETKTVGFIPKVVKQSKNMDTPTRSVKLYENRQEKYSQDSKTPPSQSQDAWYTTTKSTNENVTGFVLGLIATFTFLLPPISFVLGLFGLHYSKKNIQDSSKIKLAKTGKELSIIAISVSAAAMVGVLFAFLAGLK